MILEANGESDSAGEIGDGEPLETCELFHLARLESLRMARIASIAA